MRLLPIVLASTCLLPGLLTAQESHDDLRAEIRKIVREEIRAALADQKGGADRKVEVAIADPKPTKTPATKTRTIAVDTGRPTKSTAKAAAEEVEKLVLSLDDITNDLAPVEGTKVIRTKSKPAKQNDEKPMVFTLRCEDGKCTVEEGGGHDLVFVHGGEAGAGGECPVVKLGEGMFSLSFATDGDCCQGSDCCEGSTCCEGKESEAGECCEEAAKAAPTKRRKAEVRVLEPAEGRLEALQLRPKQVRSYGTKPLELHVEGQPIEVQIEEVEIPEPKIDEVQLPEMRIEVEPEAIEVKPLKIRSKTKKADGKQDHVVVSYRPIAV